MGTCTVTMSAAKSVTALFNGATTPTLSLTVARPSRTRRSETDPIVVSTASPAEWKLAVSSLAIAEPVVMTCSTPEGTRCKVTPSHIDPAEADKAEVTVTVETDADTAEGAQSASVSATAGTESKSAVLPFVIKVAAKQPSRDNLD